MTLNCTTGPCDHELALLCWLALSIAYRFVIRLDQKLLGHFRSLREGEIPLPQKVPKNLQYLALSRSTQPGHPSVGRHNEYRRKLERKQADEG